MLKFGNTTTFDGKGADPSLKRLSCPGRCCSDYFSDDMVTPTSKSAASAKASSGLGERKTRQRGTIVAILDGSDGPLTIPQIHALAMKAEKGKKVGIATVYRTLALLVEKGDAKTVILPTGETRYEHAHHDHHHDHFQCRNCQHVYDLHQCPVGLPDGATLPGGFSVESHELTLIGLCPNCTGKSAVTPRNGNGKKPAKSKPLSLKTRHP